jgi:hypothetical protein
MKPGDLIEWVYEYDSQPVFEDTELYSSLMNYWISIGIQPTVLISITDEFYSWLTPNGLFRALVYDTVYVQNSSIRVMVIPRVMKCFD